MAAPSVRGSTTLGVLVRRPLAAVLSILLALIFGLLALETATAVDPNAKALAAYGPVAA